MNFTKFVNFVIYEIENNMQSYGSLHWWPFSRLCGLCHLHYDFIGKVETLQSDIDILSPQIPGFQAEMRELFRVKYNKNRKEETTKAYFTQLEEELILKLYQLYEDDFQLGGYDYPMEYFGMKQS